MNITHGEASGSSRNYIYGVSEKSPYDVHVIDAPDADNSSSAGQLAFRTRAIALHPFSGLITT